MGNWSTNFPKSTIPKWLLGRNITPGTDYTLLEPGLQFHQTSYAYGNANACGFVAGGVASTSKGSTSGTFEIVGKFTGVSRNGAGDTGIFGVGVFVPRWLCGWSAYHTYLGIGIDQLAGGQRRVILFGTYGPYWDQYVVSNIPTTSSIALKFARTSITSHKVGVYSAFYSFDDGATWNTLATGVSLGMDVFYKAGSIVWPGVFGSPIQTRTAGWNATCTYFGTSNDAEITPLLPTMSPPGPANSGMFNAFNSMEFVGGGPRETVITEPGGSGIADLQTGGGNGFDVGEAGALIPWRLCAGTDLSVSGSIYTYRSSGYGYYSGPNVAFILDDCKNTGNQIWVQIHGPIYNGNGDYYAYFGRGPIGGNLGSPYVWPTGVTIIGSGFMGKYGVPPYPPGVNKAYATCNFSISRVGNIWSASFVCPDTGNGGSLGSWTDSSGILTDVQPRLSQQTWDNLIGCAIVAMSGDYDVRDDITPPTLSNEDPAPDETGVPITSSISFNLNDSESGVDPSATVVKLGVTTIWTGDAPQGGWTGTRTTITNGYHYSLTPPASFSSYTDYLVSVDFADRAFNADSGSWGFQTADVEAPVISNKVPANGLTGVILVPTISFDVTDVGIGVDPAKTVVTLNGSVIWSGDAPAVGWFGYRAIIDDTYHYELVPDFPLTRRTTYTVYVHAEDLVGNSVSTSWSWETETVTRAVNSTIQIKQISQNLLRITFDRWILIEDLQDTTKYKVEVRVGTGDDVAVVRASGFDPDNDQIANSVNLQLTKPTLGAEYKLTISNLRTSQGYLVISTEGYFRSRLTKVDSILSKLPVMYHIDLQYSLLAQLLISAGFSDETIGAGDDDYGGIVQSTKSQSTFGSATYGSNTFGG